MRNDPWLLGRLLRLTARSTRASLVGCGDWDLASEVTLKQVAQ
jgi:hypothetical protein